MEPMTQELSQMPLWGWILLGILLFTQSTWLFLDASKRKAAPWFWGIWGLIQCPTPLIVYLFVVRKIHRWIVSRFRQV